MEKLCHQVNIISANDYTVVFPTTLVNFCNLNGKLLKDFVGRKNSAQSSEQRNKIIISDVLLTFVPHFKMYQSYMNNSPTKHDER